jgi:hypothetical protein
MDDFISEKCRYENRRRPLPHPVTPAAMATRTDAGRAGEQQRVRTGLRRSETGEERCQLPPFR